MMKALFSVSKGLRTVTAAGRLVVLLYLVNLAFSLVMAVPVFNAIGESLGHSQAGERMARGFDYSWWEEFRDQNHGLATTYGPSVFGRGALLNNLEGLVQMKAAELPVALLAALLVYLILHTFLAGGVLSLYRQELPGFNLRRFLEGAVEYFPRFLGLIFLSWVFFYAIGFVLNQQLGRLLQRASANALTEKTPFFLGLAASLIVWALLMFVQMVFDYARIKTVLEDRRNIFRAALDGLRFVVKHPLSSFGVYYLLFFLGVVLSVAYVLLKESIVQSSAGGVLLAFAVQQVFILALVGVRCWTLAGQLHLAGWKKEASPMP
jgi:hypothetical protein